MKSNIKKLAVLVIVSVIALFTGVAMAWDNYHKDMNSIQGEYYFIGAGPCLLAPGGFNGFLQPNTGEPGPWDISNSTWEGIYSFKHDGKGEMTSIFRVVERPSDVWFSGPGSDIPDVGAANVYWKFHYTVSNTGRITFTYDKGSYIGDFKYGPQANTQSYLTASGPWYGVLSPEGRDIFVTWGVPYQLMITADPENNVPLFPVICNVVQQGFRCDGKCPELVYSPPPVP
jgi:hypothetical protein